VIGKDSLWPQRVVISGASGGNGVVPGVVGATTEADGDAWSLTIEHDDGTGWAENEAILPGPLQEVGAEIRQIMRSKDAFHPGDDDPDDLVIRLDKVGPMFALPVRPYAVDAGSLMMLADGVFVGLAGVQLMGVEVRNTWGESFEDEVLFDISDLGRATLATFGIDVIDAWSPAALQATQQTMVGRAVRLPHLVIGERTTVYFQVDAGSARRGKPDVDFVLLNEGGTPDPTSGMRHNSRPVFVAEVGYDNTTGTASVRVPEGTLTLTLRSVMVDQAAVTTLCRQLLNGGDGRGRPGGGGGGPGRSDLDVLLAAAKSGHCDQLMLRQLLEIICRCLRDCGHAEGCDCGGGGPSGPGSGPWPTVCLPGGMWLPLKFDYGVEIDGGFLGQHGPLAFQDPWWKVLLLIIALIAWLVGLITRIVASKTGWANSGDHPRKMGTVGASNRGATDACIIELDGEPAGDPEGRRRDHRRDQQPGDRRPRHGRADRPPGRVPDAHQRRGRRQEGVQVRLPHRAHPRDHRRPHTLHPEPTARPTRTTPIWCSRIRSSRSVPTRRSAKSCSTTMATPARSCCRGSRARRTRSSDCCIRAMAARLPSKTCSAPSIFGFSKETHMAGLDPTDPASFDRIEAIIDRAGSRWEGDPNVLGITSVLKVRGGVIDPESLVIGFHVFDKVSADVLADRGYDQIPGVIDGIPTDVVLARQRAHGSVDEKATRSQMFDTLVGGIAVGNANMNAYGTLGMTVLAESDGRMVGLTNEHVLVFDVDGHVGDEVQQPRFYLKQRGVARHGLLLPGRRAPLPGGRQPGRRRRRGRVRGSGDRSRRIGSDRPSQARSGRDAARLRRADVEGDGRDVDRLPRDTVPRHAVPAARRLDVPAPNRQPGHGAFRT